MNYSAEVRQPGFIAQDHRYVYLGGSPLALVGLSLWYPPHTLQLLAAGGVAGRLWPPFAVRIYRRRLIALLVKWTHWKTYGATVMKRPAIVRASRYFFLSAGHRCGLFAVDRVVLKLAHIVHAAIHAESNPTETLSTMVYMAYNQRSSLLPASPTRCG